MSARDREVGGLDDLFGFAEEPVAEDPPVEPKPRSRAAWLIRNALLVAVATTVTVAALRIAGTRVSILIVVAAFVSLRLLMLAVSEVAPPAVRVSAHRAVEENGEYHRTGTDSLRAAVRRWEQRLDWSQSDAERFSRNVLPVLAELTDERLRLKHGFTRASDPRRARELVGEPLWRALAEPGRRPPREPELASYVTALERL